MPQIALDKKSNFEYLEKEVGLHKFLPKSVINTNKPKPLRKLIQQHFKKYAVLGDLECMFKFFEILKSVYLIVIIIKCNFVIFIKILEIGRRVSHPQLVSP